MLVPSPTGSSNYTEYSVTSHANLLSSSTAVGISDLKTSILHFYIQQSRCSWLKGTYKTAMNIKITNLEIHPQCKAPVSFKEITKCTNKNLSNLAECERHGSCSYFERHESSYCKREKNFWQHKLHCVTNWAPNSIQHKLHCVTSWSPNSIQHKLHCVTNWAPNSIQHKQHCVTNWAPNSMQHNISLRQLNDQFDWAESDLRNSRSVRTADCLPHHYSSEPVTKGRNNYQVRADYGRAPQSVECLGPTWTTAAYYERQAISRPNSSTAGKQTWLSHGTQAGKQNAMLTFVVRFDRLSCMHLSVCLPACLPALWTHKSTAGTVPDMFCTIRTVT
jgi:hypothetical protein